TTADKAVEIYLPDVNVVNPPPIVSKVYPLFALQLFVSAGAHPKNDRWCSSCRDGFSRLLAPPGASFRSPVAPLLLACFRFSFPVGFEASVGLEVSLMISIKSLSAVCWPVGLAPAAWPQLARWACLRVVKVPSNSESS